MSPELKALLEQVHEEIKPILNAMEDAWDWTSAKQKHLENSPECRGQDKSKYIKFFPVVSPPELESIDFLLPRNGTTRLGMNWQP